MNPESANNRLMEILNYPLMNRCPELGLIFDRASIKELQEIFPTLINSIFDGLPGGIGWGMRVVRMEAEYGILCDFFGPQGPMFRLLYRLLNDSVKFTVPVSFLPKKMQQMLESGRYASFYNDIVNIDPFRRQIVSLSLNAFDYYIIHFVKHGLVPLHQTYSQAMNFDSDKCRTAYYTLTAEYLCTFLPMHPDSIVLPQNICGAIKTSAVQPPPQPMRRFKYLLLSAINQSQIPQPVPMPHIESSRAAIWRSETVLYFFVDSWLRYDFDVRDLPSSEFVRVVRILVKQIHLFGNAADADKGPMSALRHVAQPMMAPKMFNFLKSLLSRWPLDNSFIDVLETWLSFIQPWRYVFNRSLTTLQDKPLPTKYEAFIAENLVCYTQIFIKLIPRIERTDLSTQKNAFMLFRMLKVFGQSNLAILIRCMEETNAYMDRSGPSPHHSPNRSESDWRPFSRAENLQHEEPYTYLFGDEFIQRIKELASRVMIAHIIAQRNLDEMLEARERKFRGFVGFLKRVFGIDDEPNYKEILDAKKKIPEYLQWCTYEIQVIWNIQMQAPDASQVDSMRSFDTTDHNLSDYSLKSKHFKYTGDPALMPINETREIAFLVRFLHQFSCKLNLMPTINEYWCREDITGRITRQILLPPMIAQKFDKSTGISELVSTDLPPRIYLRPLASYRVIVLIIAALLVGLLQWGAPSFGLFILALFVCLRICLRAVFIDVPIEEIY